MRLPGNYNNYAFLLKTNSYGVQQWSQTYGGTTNLTTGNNIALTKDGGYIIAGFTQGLYSAAKQIYVAKTNKNGDTLWTRTYGDTTLYGFANTIQQTSDGGFITGAR